MITMSRYLMIHQRSIIVLLEHHKQPILGDGASPENSMTYKPLQLSPTLVNCRLWKVKRINLASLFTGNLDRQTRGNTSPPQELIWLPNQCVSILDLDIKYHAILKSESRKFRLCIFSTMKAIWRDWDMTSICLPTSSIQYIRLSSKGWMRMFDYLKWFYLASFA